MTGQYVIFRAFPMCMSRGNGVGLVLFNMDWFKSLHIVMSHLDNIRLVIYRKYSYSMVLVHWDWFYKAPGADKSA